jgi:hypothetical protein
MLHIDAVSNGTVLKIRAACLLAIIGGCFITAWLADPAPKETITQTIYHADGKVDVEFDTVYADGRTVKCTSSYEAIAVRPSRIIIKDIGKTCAIGNKPENTEAQPAPAVVAEQKS